MLDAAVEEGCTFWDTADLYGDNEELVGKWLVLSTFPHRSCLLTVLSPFGRFKRTGKRDQIFLATKFGFVPGQSGVVDGRPEYVKTAAELSLKKLGVDVVDLYYLHVCPFISSLQLIS